MGCPAWRSMSMKFGKIQKLVCKYGWSHGVENWLCAKLFEGNQSSFHYKRTSPPFRRQQVQLWDTRPHISLSYTQKFSHWTQMPWLISSSSLRKETCETIMPRGAKKQLEASNGRREQVYVTHLEPHGY
jgi:hypothetical protein